MLDNQIENESVTIDLNGIRLYGFLKVPKDALGLVIFVHGSGSSRFSRRNRAVADYLFKKNMGTLLFDLLTEKEEEYDQLSAGYRFNIPFLAGRLMEVTDWMIKKFEAEKKNIFIGYFGASTGAAAAIEAAVEYPGIVKAIVSRGGRPDLAALALSEVKAPTLLIVGGNDTEVLSLNQSAWRSIHAPKELYIVKGATHLFEEPGALEEVARVAAQWFEKYF
ncbi:MAG: alpha/beta hydrolase [Candidatus Omnitrophica bacterium]|nr:alpha/beta hydrolase [Candidatus Omnitrophota bacterium]